MNTITGVVEYLAGVVLQYYNFPDNAVPQYCRIPDIVQLC